MNKNRIFGAGMLIIGVILNYSFDNDKIGFISALIIGFGIGVLLTGRFTSKSKI